jgi:hypothetical protein
MKGIATTDVAKAMPVKKERKGKTKGRDSLSSAEPEA